MPIAVNKQTGEVLSLQDGQWKPAKTAINKQTGQRLVLDGDNWKPLESNNAAKPEEGGVKEALASGLAHAYLGYEAGTRGFASGISAGFADEAASAIQAPLRSLQSGKPISESYDEALRERRETNKAFKNASPIIGNTAEVAGAIMQPTPFGKAKAATTVGKGALGAIRGTTTGAVNAAGFSENRGGELVNDIIEGGRTGALLGGTIQAAPKLAKDTGSLIKKGINKAIGFDDEAARAFKEVGIDPTIAATSGRGGKIMQNSLSNIPAAGGVVEKSVDKVNKQLAAKVSQIADNLSDMQDPEVVGRNVQKGAENFVERFKSKANVLYNKVDDQIDSKKPTNIDNTIKFLNTINNRLKETPEIAKALKNPAIQKLQTAIEKDLKPSERQSVILDVAGIPIKADARGGNLTYGALKALRTEIGAKLSDFSLVDDIPRAELKRFYKALSQDMEKAAVESGEGALKAFKRASAFYDKGIDRIDNYIEPLLKKNTPEEAYNYLVNSTKNGSTRIRALKKSLKPEEFQALQSLTIRRMGRATAGAQDDVGEVFSPKTFLTNWNKMDKKAKDSFFGLDNELRQSLDRLTKIGNNLNKVSNLRNTSNTAPNMVGMGLVYGSTQSAAILAAIPAAYVGAKLMTSPKFVNWLADTSKVQSNDALSKQIAKLAVIDFENPDVELGVKAFVDNLRGN